MRAVAAAFIAFVAVVPVAAQIQVRPLAQSARRAASSPALSPDAALAFQRGVVALRLGAWPLAIEDLTAIDQATPGVPVVLYDLGVAHAGAGHGAAASAWLRTYLAAAPGSPDASRVQHQIARIERRLQDLVQQLVADAQALQQQIDATGIRAGTIRGLATATARMALQAGEPSLAQATLTAIEDIDDRDGAWGEIATALSEHPDERDTARLAASHIADARGRSAAQARIPTDTPPAPADAVTAWRGLALDLSSAADERDVAGRLRTIAHPPTEADLARAPVGLMELACTFADDALRIKKLQSRLASP